MTFRAKYRGRCAACRESIEPGELVEYDQDDRLVHDDCDGDYAEAAQADRDAEREVCGECWLLKPCGCEEA